MAPTFYIHLYWSEDQQCYNPKGDALEIYEKEIDLFVKQHSGDLFFQEKSDQDKHFLKTNLLTIASSFFHDDLSHPKTFPVLKVDENDEKFIEFGLSDRFPYSFRTTWKFHHVPETQRIRPHKVIWYCQGEMFCEQLSFPTLNEEERVLDITWKNNNH